MNWWTFLTRSPYVLFVCLFDSFPMYLCFMLFLFGFFPFSFIIDHITSCLYNSFWVYRLFYTIVYKAFLCFLYFTNRFGVNMHIFLWDLPFLLRSQKVFALELGKEVLNFKVKRSNTHHGSYTLQNSNIFVCVHSKNMCWLCWDSGLWGSRLLWRLQYILCWSSSFWWNMSQKDESLWNAFLQSSWPILCSQHIWIGKLLSSANWTNEIWTVLSAVRWDQGEIGELFFCLSSCILVHADINKCYS